MKSIKCLSILFVVLGLVACVEGPGGPESNDTHSESAKGGLTPDNPLSGISLDVVNIDEWNSQLPRGTSTAYYDENNGLVTVTKNNMVINTQELAISDVCPTGSGSMNFWDVDEERWEYLISCSVNSDLKYYVVLDKDFNVVWTSPGDDFQPFDATRKSVFIQDGIVYWPSFRSNKPLVKIADYASDSQSLWYEYFTRNPEPGFSGVLSDRQSYGLSVFDDSGFALRYFSYNHNNGLITERKYSIVIVNADGEISAKFNQKELVEEVSNYFGKSLYNVGVGHGIADKGNGVYKLAFRADDGLAYVLNVPSDKLHTLVTAVNNPQNLPGNTLSCNTYSDLCVSYVFENTLDKTSYSADCSIPVVSCPSTNRVYTCDVTNGSPVPTSNGTAGGVEYSFHLYSPTYNVTSAAQSCLEAQALYQ